MKEETNRIIPGLFDNPRRAPDRSKENADTSVRILTGTVETIYCYKEDSAWALVGLQTPSGLRKVSGIMPAVRLGMTAEYSGQFADTPKYGLTFKADSFTERLPSDIPGIEKYLASGLIRNIGPVLSRQIVAAFGDKTLEVLDNDPERLREVHGIGSKRVQSIIDSIKEQKEIRSIMIWLKRYDLSNGLAAKIFQTYGGKSISVLEENPYVLTDDIHGVGFKRADAVAKLLGVPEQSQFRIRSGIIACLEDEASSGNTFVPVGRLVARTASEAYLDIPQELVQITVMDNTFDKIVLDGDDVFLRRFYHAENRIAEKLLQLNATATDCGMPDFRRIEKETGFTYSDEQKGAVMSAFCTDVLVITGGPGTGKTATTNAIIKGFEYKHKNVLLAAPTGRAAKRMNEVTGRPAKTIHRLLEYSQGGFNRCRDYPLEGDVLIVDESSMIDTLLMRDLVAAVPPGMKLILVGDMDQLPSVGAGSVLRDVIESGEVTTVRLTQIYRQAQDSAIIMGAHAVNHGRMPSLDNAPGTDLWFFRKEDKNEAASLIVDLVSNRIPKKFGYPAGEIQVLTPMRREGDALGASELNRMLQKAVNPSGKPAATKGDTVFLTGDRIMQTKNNYDKDIFNGDIGRVVGKLSGLDPDKAVLETEFDDRTVRLTQADIADIELAYACTVHKSQGSEYPVVVMPMHENHYIMLKRNLLYTGITRAKKQCVIVGTRDAIQTAVRHEDTVKRNTRLKERLMTIEAPPQIRTTLF